MICRQCGSENTESAKFCGKCGSPLSDIANTSDSEFQPETTSDISDGTSIPPVEPKKKKWLIPVLIACIAAAAVIVVLLVFNLGQSRVYKYDSCAIDASDMSDDEFVQFFGGSFAQAIFNELLGGSYIEVHRNDDVTILIPNLGYRTISSNQWSSDAGGGSCAVDEDYTYIHTDGITLVFRRATDEEVESYEYLRETAPEITEDSWESVFGSTDTGTTNGIPTQK